MNTHLRFATFLLLLLQVCIPVHLQGVAWCCSERPERLMDDLQVVEYWDCRICQKFPTFYNHLLQGGYVNMPSSRMGADGELSLGYSWVPPYHNWNARAQLLERLELSINYRVFRGVEDPVLSQFGFGDFSDKGANAKFAILLPEDSGYLLPGIAVGTDDFLGTRAFKSRYIVATKVFMDLDMEASIGWGEWRIRGFFGGFSWMPFRKCPYPYLSGLSLCAEYDAIPYKSEKREPHPDGRVKKNPINFGVKWRFWDTVDLSASYVRGDAFAFSASAFYNFGETKGFVPKVDNPLPYRAPINCEPLGRFRSESMMSQELIYAFHDQGLDLLEASIHYDYCCQKVLRLSIYNDNYRLENELREHINYLLAFVIPCDIDKVNVVVLSDGFPVQEYRYYMPYVRKFGGGCMGAYELKVLTPLCEVSYPDPYCSKKLFETKRSPYYFSLLPDFRSFFGSSKGKFKFTFGLIGGVEGFFYNDIYYCIKAGYLFFSDIDNVRGVDRLNPSQIINVKSDLPLYLKQRGVTFPELYIRKVWNMGQGWYHKLALGYFERQYGGIASELLWYPVCSRWALGIEGALLGKRTHTGLGFTDEIRKFHGFIPSYQKFIGYQYFANIYYDWKDMNMDFRIKAGQFLARDVGIRYEISRYFSSGLRLTMWYTRTNGNDRLNGETYYDKGIMISMPLDIFYTCSSRSRWRYGMSAWLRDVGVSAYTGEELYYLINDQRQN